MLGLWSGFGHAEAPADAFSGEADAAYMRSTGSSKEIFKGRLDTHYVVNAWTHEFKAEGLNESDDNTGKRSSERYLVLAKSSWNFTASDYLFVKAQYEKDQQTDHDYQALLAAGYGRQLFKSDAVQASVDVGAGDRHSQAAVVDESTDEFVGNVAFRLAWKFREGGRLTEDASTEFGEKGTVLRTRTALLFDLTDVLGLSFAYETKHDDSLGGVDDSLTTAGLNYRFR